MDKYKFPADLIPAVEAGSGGVNHFPLVAGRYYLSQYFTVPDFQGLQLTADTVFLMPFLVSEETTFDRIGLNVTTLDAAATIHLGIYSGNTPGTRVLNAGTVSGATTGAKEAVINQTLTPGIYWLAALSVGGAPSISAITSGDFNASFLGESAISGSQNARITRAAVGGALPSPFGAITYGTSHAPMLFLRAA